MLNNVKILDFSTLLPGPFATLMLADMGADILRVESPTREDLVRNMPPMMNESSVIHQYINRSKNSIALDLKSPQAIEIVKKLILEYDVVIEQFRPNVMKKLGLDYDTLKAINPKLIYCSITGYGQTGPYKDRAGHDINYLAIAGISSYSKRKQQAPVPQAVQIADMAGGSLHAVIGIVTALYHRELTGEGQMIDVSMTDCAFTLNAISAAGTLSHNEIPSSESQLLNGGSYYDYYQTADDRYLSVGSLEPKFFQGLCQALGLAYLIPLANDPAKQDEIKSQLVQCFKTKTLAQWQLIFAELDICVEPVLNLKEASEHQQLVARGMIANVPHQHIGRQKQMSFPIKFSAFQPRYLFAGKNVGEDSKKVLLSLGYSEEDIKNLAQDNVVYGDQIPHK